MTDDELQAIEERAETAAACWEDDHGPAVDFCAEDAPKLIAEVRRLRKALEAPINRYDVVYNAGRNRRRATVDAYSAHDALTSTLLSNRGSLIRSVEPNPGGSLGDAPDPETE